MKSLRLAVFTFMVLTAVAAFAASDSQKSFDNLKALAGSWTGKGSEGQPIEVSYRAMSGGSALMSEIHGQGEDMITMFHTDSGRLLMTHYCAAGNQPRMTGAMSPDGKTFTFNFLDATNLSATQKGHMERLVLTMIDANHHTEDWEFSAKDGQKHHELFDLQRKN
jgi:hypothetical protein